MIGYVSVRLHWSKSEYLITPIEYKAKGRILHRKSRVIRIKSGWIQDNPTFRRYMRRLKKLGFTSDYDNQYWM